LALCGRRAPRSTHSAITSRASVSGESSVCSQGSYRKKIPYYPRSLLGGRSRETVGQSGICIGLRRLELGGRQVSHLPEVGALERRPLKVGALEVREVCGGVAEVHPCQPPAFEVYAHDVQRAREPPGTTTTSDRSAEMKPQRRCVCSPARGVITPDRSTARPPTMPTITPQRHRFPRRREARQRRICRKTSATVTRPVRKASGYTTC
jgi:hypothetical protein